MIERIITGGQSGVDQAAWHAARAAGLATGGWMPLGFLTELGPCPHFAHEFGAREHTTEEYADRTIANVKDAEAVLVFAGTHCGAGVRLTIDASRALAKPCLVIEPDRLDTAETAHEVATWIDQTCARTLQVAGDRASVLPDLGPRVETFLIAVFRRVLRSETPSS